MDYDDMTVIVAFKGFTNSWHLTSPTMMSLLMAFATIFDDSQMMARYIMMDSLVY